MVSGSGFCKKFGYAYEGECVVSMLTMGNYCASSHTYLLCSIRDLLQLQWSVQIKHVYREVNFMANRLAAMAGNLQLGYHSWVCPSSLFFV